MGLASMLQRFLGGGRQSTARRAATQTAAASDSAGAAVAADVSNMGVPRGLKPMSHSPVTPTNEFFVPMDDWSLVSKVIIG